MYSERHLRVLMENENHRWSYMTEEQLARRLKKITKPEKLECFISLARRRGNGYLRELAQERQVDLGLIEAALYREPSVVAEVKAKVKEKWEKAKEVEIDERFVDF